MKDGGIRSALASQFSASITMLEECLHKCPEEQWDGLIAKYPFWHVAYHTLCFIECYLWESNEAFAAEVERRAANGGPNFHPAGMAELQDEYPSRRFERGELLAFAEHCRGVVRRVLLEGGDAALESESGFAWLPFNRMELHTYNLRHAQHHIGQLGAFLRRHGVELGWVKMG